MVTIKFGRLLMLNKLCILCNQAYFLVTTFGYILEAYSTNGFNYICNQVTKILWYKYNNTIYAHKMRIYIYAYIRKYARIRESSSLVTCVLVTKLIQIIKHQLITM